MNSLLQYTSIDGFKGEGGRQKIPKVVLSRMRYGLEFANDASQNPLSNPH